jgi:hypothetical protein
MCHCHMPEFRITVCNVYTIFFFLRRYTTGYMCMSEYENKFVPYGVWWCRGIFLAIR